MRDSTVNDADSVAEDIDLRLSHQVVGTLAYLPPEAVRRAPPSLRSFDRWSLSVTLYDALTGPHPFRRSSVYETVNEIVMREAPEGRQIRPDCPAALAELLAERQRHDSRRRAGSAESTTVALAGCV